MPTEISRTVAPPPVVEPAFPPRAVLDKISVANNYLRETRPNVFTLAIELSDETLEELAAERARLEVGFVPASWDERRAIVNRWAQMFRQGNLSPADVLQSVDIGAASLAGEPRWAIEKGCRNLLNAVNREIDLLPALARLRPAVEACSCRHREWLRKLRAILTAEREGEHKPVSAAPCSGKPDLDPALSPQERREAMAQWAKEVARQIAENMREEDPRARSKPRDPIELYLAANPGATREDAIAHLAAMRTGKGPPSERRKAS
jgi:hypothetical protein